MLPSLQELLTLAGFTLRGKRRATCGWCGGRDDASYTETYVHCFRCNVTKGYITLARELGYITKTLSDVDRAKLEEIRIKEKRRIEFLAWQNTKLNIIIEKLRALNWRVRLAKFALNLNPEYEPAWAMLAKFYHQEARLFAAFDFFSMAPVSGWLEQECGPKELIAIWRNEQAR